MNEASRSDKPIGDQSRNRPRRAPSIRSLVAVTMIVPAVVLTLALIVLASIATRSIGDRLGRTALREATGRVESQLEAYLGEAEQLSASLAALIGVGLLPSDDLDVWPEVLARQLPSFPAVAIVVFARPDREMVGVVNDPTDLLSLRGRDGVMIERPHREDDPRSPRTYDFDPTTRPWHVKAMAHVEPVWTDPYPFVRRELQGFDVGTSFTRAVRDDRNELLGVLSVDVTFGALDTYLATMPLALAGHITVVDGHGLLVADSRTPSTDGLGSRREAPAAIRDLVGITPDRDAGDARLIELDGETQLAIAVPMAVGPDRSWSVIATVPLAAVRSAAVTTQLRLATVSLLALAATLFASLWLGRRIADPVRALRDHVRRVGAGEVRRRLDLKAAREFEQLSTDLNVMARDLEERLKLRQSISMAGQVQQALLPAPDLIRSGFVLHGCSRFCESIGGDYFDFIEIPEREAVLIAVGDVMGHGIDSALLMATARAALRSEVRRTESLGAMLIRINSVLLQGGAHGRFMTMFLLMLEPRRGRIRWANAGHEAGVLVRPGTDAVEELAGGDIPLGIDLGVVYFEHSMEDLSAESLIMVGTDGLREALDPVGEAFGEDRIRSTLLTNAELPLGDLAARLTEAVALHLGPNDLNDDLTFVLARLLEPRADAKR